MQHNRIHPSQPFWLRPETGSGVSLSQHRLSPSRECLPGDPAQDLLDMDLSFPLPRQCWELSACCFCSLHVSAPALEISAVMGKEDLSEAGPGTVLLWLWMYSICPSAQGGWGYSAGTRTCAFGDMCTHLSPVVRKWSWNPRLLRTQGFSQSFALCRPCYGVGALLRAWLNVWAGARLGTAVLGCHFGIAQSGFTPIESRLDLDHGKDNLLNEVPRDSSAISHSPAGTVSTNSGSSLLGWLSL